MPDSRPSLPELPSCIQGAGDDTLLAVRVVPRAGRTGLAGERAGALLIRLAAAPVDGAANVALTAFIADCLDVPKRAVTLVAGERSRDKRIRIERVAPLEVARRLKRFEPE